MTRNHQQSINFGAAYNADQAFRDSMRALGDVYDAAGSLVCAGATGIDKGDLAKMFEAGSGRHMRLKAAIVIGQLGSLELRRRALEPIAVAWGLSITDQVPMSDKERADRAEAALLALGPIGAQALASAMGRR